MAGLEALAEPTAQPQDVAPTDPSSQQPSATTEPQGQEDEPMYSIESLCMNCRENGTTRLLMTKIPHFREIVVMAFECPHCGEKNNEVQFAGALGAMKCTMALKVPEGDAEALNRQVVKSESATIKIPELDFEIPPDTQKGSLSTVEGVLSKAAADLGALQEERRKVDADVAAKIDEFLVKLEECTTGKRGFTLELTDPAGNSFIQSPCAPAPDPQLSVAHFNRTPEELEKLGFKTSIEEGGTTSTSAAEVEAQKPGYVPAGTAKSTAPTPHGSVGATRANQAIAAECTPEQAESILGYSTPEEVMTFPAHCSACGAPSETRMYVTKIPYFKEVIIMSTACDGCGYRSSELKAGGSISAKGKRICLLVKNSRDLSRDVIKSDTAGVIIPELDLELTPGTLGGRVTTVEGLVSDIEVNLGKVFPFQIGDSAPVWQRGKWQEIRDKLKALTEFESDWHLILDDTLANSFIAPVTGDTVEEDPQLALEEYTRTFEQDEELGLNDMNTDEQID